MKKTITVILLLLSVGVFGQTIDFKTGGSLEAKTYFITGDQLYFHTTDKNIPYKIPLQSLSSYPPTSTITYYSPEKYLMKFRKGQLSGIWLTLLGAVISGVGVATEVDPLTYGGIACSAIGFGVYIGSYSNLKKRFVITEAVSYGNLATK